MIGFCGYALIVVVLLRRYSFAPGNYGLAPFTLLGVTLSIYLVFRNNASFDRWWEGRKLWGQLVVDIRNLARVIVALVPAHDVRRQLLMQSAAFCHLLRGQLRQVDAGPEARNLIGAAADPALACLNPPDSLVRSMGREIAELKRAGSIGAVEYRILDERLASIAAVQAGCERIAATPVPFAYTLLLHRSAYVFCLLLPFGLAASAGWYTPLFTTFVAYSFFGLDALSEELEEPFGTAPNDLPLDALCRVCEISIFEALGEPPPPPLSAQEFLLT